MPCAIADMGETASAATTMRLIIGSNLEQSAGMEAKGLFTIKQPKADDRNQLDPERAPSELRSASPCGSARSESPDAASGTTTRIFRRRAEAPAFNEM